MARRASRQRRALSLFGREMLSTFTIEPPDVNWRQVQKRSCHLNIVTPVRTWRVPIWICCDRPNDPFLLLIGGQHGDEYQGCGILLEFLQTQWGRLHGNVIVIPEVNPPALEAGTRTSPLDGGNLNRAFPGRTGGTITEAIAHFISTEILPLVDFVVDIHSGGGALEVPPSVMTHYLPIAETFRETLSAMRATELPVSIVVDEGHKDGMLDTLVEIQGKPFLCVEMGGGHLQARDIRLGLRMVENLIARRNPEMVAQHVADRPSWAPLLLESPGPGHYVRASAGGLFFPAVAAGDTIRRGQTIGRLYPRDPTPGDSAVSITAPLDGVVYVVRVSVRVEPGDDLIIVAAPAHAALAGMWGT